MGRWGRIVEGPPEDVGLLIIIEPSDTIDWTPPLGAEKPPFRVSLKSDATESYLWLDGDLVEEMVGVPDRIPGRYRVEWALRGGE